MASYLKVPGSNGLGPGWLLLRSDSVPNFMPPPNADRVEPNNQGWISHWHVASAEELKEQLQILGKKFSLNVPGNPETQIYPLLELPEGYVMWVCHKYHQDALDINAKSNKLGDDKFRGHRRDYYIYGHKNGRFRSYDEILPHLIYLAFDTTSLHANCVCVRCAGDKDLDDVANLGGGTDTQMQKRVPQTLDNIDRAKCRREVPVVQFDQDSKERLSDLAFPIVYILRPGEIAWYDRLGNGQEWRLGVVTSRTRRKDIGSEPEYTIQPLSHPQEHLPEIPSIPESNTRVFLAWTLPATSETLTGMLHEDVNWLEHFRLRRQQDPTASCVIDSSILAAKQVDASHSLIEPLQSEDNLHAPETTQTQYIGMFLGAEKVWVGEAVRLRSLHEEKRDRTLVLVIRQIIEKTPGPTATLKVTKKAPKSKSAVSDSTPAKPSQPILHLVGDVYELLKEGTLCTEKERDSIGLTSQIVEDVSFLNKVEKQKGGPYSGWKVVERDAIKLLGNLAGRWYPTSKLANSLRGSQVVQEELRSGSIRDIGFDLNSRMHHATIDERKRKDRKDAYGSSVPDTFRLSRGLDALNESAMDLDP